MKKLLFASIMMLSFGVISFAGDNREIQKIKAQQKVLKLNTKLAKLRLCYEKAIAETAELETKAAEANIAANSSTTTYYSTMDAKATAKAAKEQAKALDKVKKANARLAKSQKNVQKIQRKIDKIQDDLDKMNKKIEFVNQ